MNLKTLKGLSYKAKYKRIVRFLKSNYYTIRKSTHIGLSIPKDATDKALYFLKKVINIRKQYDYYLSCILNCDETPITFDSPLSSTLSKIGKKSDNCQNIGK